MCNLTLHFIYLIFLLNFKCFHIQGKETENSRHSQKCEGRHRGK